MDPHCTFHNAARGRADVSRFAAAAWNAPVRLTTPISASVTTADTDLPRIRFVMDGGDSGDPRDAQGPVS